VGIASQDIPKEFRARTGDQQPVPPQGYIAYSYAAPHGGQLGQPVLFVNSGWDAICDINHLVELMHRSCKDLFVTNLPAGHWPPLGARAKLFKPSDHRTKGKPIRDRVTKANQKRKMTCQRLLLPSILQAHSLIQAISM
jgi:hypothetical protein